MAVAVRVVDVAPTVPILILPPSSALLLYDSYSAFVLPVPNAKKRAPRPK